MDRTLYRIECTQLGRGPLWLTPFDRNNKAFYVADVITDYLDGIPGIVRDTNYRFNEQVHRCACPDLAALRTWFGPYVEHLSLIETYAVVKIDVPATDVIDGRSKLQVAYKHTSVLKKEILPLSVLIDENRPVPVHPSIHRLRDRIRLSEGGSPTAEDRKV